VRRRPRALRADRRLSGAAAAPPACAHAAHATRSRPPIPSLPRARTSRLTRHPARARRTSILSSRAACSTPW
jgi:hypothetical protein